MTTRLAAGVALLFLAMPTAHAVDLDRPDVEAFIASMVKEHDYDREDLRDILGEAEKKDSILEAISKPAEKTLTWAEYRKIFLTKERINAGAAFWRENREDLEDIESRTGVPIEMLVGIIGVETYYGRITGGHRVVDALATLAFYYPPRSKFFRSELEHFLLLIREEDMDATDAFGSYAGAMNGPAAVHAVELSRLRRRLDRRRQARHLEQLERRCWQHRQLFQRPRLAQWRRSHHASNHRQHMVGSVPGKCPQGERNR